MALKGSKPKQEDMRLKAYLYGPPNSGKTLAALQFPDAYIIDTAKETQAYKKLIDQKNSIVFNCSDFSTILNEIHELSITKHNFKTVVIDEATTIYQNLQRDWTEKFIEASYKTSKNESATLLQDFGMRYWDRVKKDWRRLIDALRNLDMNVIVNAHQKDKYGPGQVLMGITSDSEKSDEYVFDFVFRLFIKNNEYFAKTEKQRILPTTIDPEAKRFPDEFKWNYDNLLKFYNKKYLEKQTIYSDTEIKPEAKTKEIKPRVLEKPPEIKQPQNENKTIKEEKKQESTQSNNPQPIDINFIKSLLKENNIKASSFKVFLRDVCMWTHVQKLSNLNQKELETIVNRWDSIKAKYSEYDNTSSDDDDNDTQPQQNITNKNNLQPVNETNDTSYRETCLKNIKDGDSIRNDQISMLKELLQDKNIEVERLFTQFNMKEWNEMTQDGAANIIKYFDMFASSL